MPGRRILKLVHLRNSIESLILFFKPYGGADMDSRPSKSSSELHFYSKHCFSEQLPSTVTRRYRVSQVLKNRGTVLTKSTFSEKSVPCAYSYVFNAQNTCPPHVDSTGIGWVVRKRGAVSDVQVPQRPESPDDKYPLNCPDFLKASSC